MNCIFCDRVIDDHDFETHMCCVISGDRIKITEHYIPKSKIESEIIRIEDSGPRWEGDDSNDEVVKELKKLLEK